MGLSTWYDALLNLPQGEAPRRTPAPGGHGRAQGGMPAPQAPPQHAGVWMHDDPPTAGLPQECGPARPSALGAMLSAETPAERQRSVTTMLRALGFDHFGYTRFSLLGEQCTPVSFCTTYADRGWAEHYFRQQYHQVDPRLQLALHSYLPAVWSLEQLATLAAREPADSRLRRFVADLAAFGMQHGTMLALPGKASGERHVASLLSTTPGSLVASDHQMGQVLTLVMCLLEFYTRDARWFQPPPRPGGGIAPPTTLQREILACMSRGLCDKQIATQLGLSLHAVDYHLRQLRRRFGVRNRVQLMQATQQLPP